MHLCLLLQFNSVSASLLFKSLVSRQKKLVYSTSSMEPSSSSSSYARISYDVFLSFRGEGTRTFTDHLYASLRQAGVNVWRDNEEIERGENISIELSKAIEESRVAIIVFSKTYAQSRWCLDELVKILECRENLEQKVVPVFFGVDPSEVRKQTGEYGNALAHHRQRFGDQKVDEWKDALTMVANLSGWDLQTMENGFESKFINAITEEVLGGLNFIPINVVKHPVGIDSHVRDILHLLQTQTNDDVKMIGIFGMGGVGKTTLAIAICNLCFKRFEHSCFIADIRSHVSEWPDGLIRLQERLLCQTLRRKNFEIDNVVEGISLIKEGLQSKRVLIILDDIDDTTQLESLAGQRNWFGCGSVVIITTRNVHLLSDLRAHEKYGVEPLSSNDSLQLFSWHAFGVPVPPKDYTELSERILSNSGGLPLALIVFGSYLYGRSVEEWNSTIEKLRRVPENKIQHILRKSYDTLDNDTRSIFLDIACFFIGLDKTDIVQDFGFRFEIGIRTLTERCLLTIDTSGGKEKLQMHALVQGMAREIARQESPRDRSNRSRLMDPDDVYDVIKGNKGTKAIEGMYVDSNMLRDDKPLSTEVLSRMKNLRLLKLDGVHLKGSFKCLPKELRWFWWHNCHLRHIPSDFHHEKLEVLHLQGSKIKRVHLKMQHFKSLKILNLGGCEQLEKTPDFTGAQSLQILSFKYCKNLVKLHSSIGCLERLIELDLSFCEKLKELPISICQLKSLQFLYINDCSSLKKFPFDLGKLEQLRKLLGHSTNISLLPRSLGHLRNLKILSVGGHNDLLLPPKSKSHLVGLFPPSVAKLCSLEALYITERYLHEVDLPIDLERLSSLKFLSLKGSYYLKSLPFCLSQLSKLESLELEGCLNLKSLVGLPPNLLKLSAKDCASLEKIADISNLKRLKELYIPNCKSLVEVPGLESLDSIQRLDITNCSALSIPLIESGFQAHSKGGDVEIWLQIVGSFLYCTIPSLLTREFFDIIHGGFDPNYSYEARIIVRNKSTGALIEKEVSHVNCMCLKRHHPLTLHIELEDGTVLNKSERFHFKVRIKVGEEVEVYAVFNPLKIFCLCVIHRNRDGEVHFFPSTKGFREFDEIAESTERFCIMAPEEEEVGNSWEKEESRVRIVEIIDGSPPVSPRLEKKKGPSLLSPAIAKRPRINNESTSSEKIRKLLDEAARLMADGSKLKRGISEYLDNAQQSKEVMTPELLALHTLRVQIEGYTATMEMTQCLMETLKKYEVERQARRELEDRLINYNGVVDVSSYDSNLPTKVSSYDSNLRTKKSNNDEGRLPEKLKGIGDDDKVLELFFTPKKFEGIVVVKLGEAIVVTGTGMCSLKPGEMIQDDVINSYEFILREKAGTQPKCWYLPTYICQEGNQFCETYERNFEPYVTKSSCDIIYLPVFLNAHWYLLKADTKLKRGLILDSYIVPYQRQARLEEAKKTMRALHDLLKFHTLRDPSYKYEADFEDWKFETAYWVPQQDNGVDCGAFVMLFMEMADRLTERTVFNIDMDRRRIALELLYHPRNDRLSLVYNSVKDQKGYF